MTRRQDLEGMVAFVEEAFAAILKLYQDKALNKEREKD